MINNVNVSKEFNQNHLKNELKKFLVCKYKLKNDFPIKYWFLNVNVFIHFFIGLLIIWKIWVLSSLLFPTNNQLIISDGNFYVIFETAFNYIFKNNQITYDNKLSTRTSSNNWYSDAYSFLNLSIFLFLLSIYTFFIIKNFLIDIKEIFKSCGDQQNFQKINKISKFLNLLIIVFCLNLFFTVLLSLYTFVDGSKIISFIFDAKTESRKSYYLNLKPAGIFLLLINFLSFFTIIYFYVKFCIERFNNNHFFLKVGRLDTWNQKPEKTLSQKKTLNSSNIYKLTKKNRNFYARNTPGYFAELKNIDKIFYNKGKEFFALKNINLTIKKGEFIAILGPSGSGKTTLLNILSGIDIPTRGSIILDNCDTTKMNDYNLNIFRRQKIGYIFQHYALLPNLTARENIEISAYLKKDELKKKNHAQYKKEYSESKNWSERWAVLKKFIKHIFIETSSNKDLNSLLNILNLSEHAHKYPHQLSGGQQQRVAIARSLIKKPIILFADEATGALDHETAKTVLKLFDLINKFAKTTVIIITHNPAIAKIADRVLNVHEGRIKEDIKNLNPTKIDDLKNL